MNERIKELAGQAGITTNLDTDYFEKDMNKWVDYFSEKFAALIIRECTQVCNDVDAEYNGEDVLATWCAQAINKHFGIE